MLLSIFIFLVAFSLILIIGGYYIEAPVMQIAGTAFMFITGLILLGSSIEYVSGENTEMIFVYGNNLTGYHWDYDDADAPIFNNPNDPSAVFTFHTIQNSTNVYSTWEEEIIQGISIKQSVAVLLMISSILIFVSVYSHLREGKNIDDE